MITDPEITLLQFICAELSGEPTKEGSRPGEWLNPIGPQSPAAPRCCPIG
jgi:hypothetical protein